MRLLLKLLKLRKANKKARSHGESVHDWGISFCVKKLEVGEGQKHVLGLSLSLYKTNATK